MVGETISHYQIVERIGAGGMGEVYRARDPRLGRDVAIKTLSPSFGADVERVKRFEREARAVASLNHPNVLAVYDVGIHGGMPYLVSELLEGESLRERIAEGGLTARKAVEYAVQVAEGLAAAHAKGIIHRDLKPENLFITRDGHVKILDFGLAKLRHRDPPSGGVNVGSTATLLTDAGSVVGTVSYMSPEQLQGVELDHRSDIFSFGVVLYEMLTGRRPFTGETAPEIAASILRDEPPDLADAARRPLPTLERVVRQCLEKRPEDRFELARDLALMLRAVTDSGSAVTAASPRGRRWRRLAVVAALVAVVAVAAILWTVLRRSSPPPLPARLHVAVLPFEAARDEGGQALVAKGLAASVADDLELLEEQTHGDLWVVPPRLAGDLEAVRRQYGVTAAVSGSLLLDEDRLRLDLALLDAAGGEPVRATTIEDSGRNLESLQQEPVLRVAAMLGVPVEASTRATLDRLTTNVRRAYLAYLRGRGALMDGPGDLEVAVTSLEEATREDPSFGPARVALARALLESYRSGHDPALLERATEEARKAVAVGDPRPDASLVLAAIATAQDRPEEAVTVLEEAVRTAPRSGEAHVELGRALEAAGRFGEAEAAFQKAINLRPGYWVAPSLLGALYVNLSRYDAAANEFRAVTELAPGNPLGYNNLGGLMYYLGRMDEARRYFERSLEAQPTSFALSNLGTLYFEQSRYGDAAKMFERALELEPDDYLLVGNLANATYWGGERERAEQMFRRAIELGTEDLKSRPGDVSLLANLAGYCGMVGEDEEGRTLLERAAAGKIDDAELMATIGESYEDVGDRARAVRWIGKALESGLAPEWVENRPSLRKLVGDAEFKALMARYRQPE